MTRLELITKTALAAGLTKVQVARAIDAYYDAAISGLKRGEIVYLNIGNFYVHRTPARNGRNPKTGATILIRPKNIVKFSQNQLMKDAVN